MRSLAEVLDDFDMSDPNSAFEVFGALSRAGLTPEQSPAELWVDGPLKAERLAPYLNGLPGRGQAELKALLPYLKGKVTDGLIEPDAMTLLETFLK